MVWCRFKNVASTYIPAKMSAHAFPVLKNAAPVHQNCQAINQLSRYRRRPAPILQSEEHIVVMDRLNRRRAKQSGCGEVGTEFAMLSSQFKSAREWEVSTYARNIGVLASTCNRHINNKMTVSHEV
jgi:hypothetical protein